MKDYAGRLMFFLDYNVRNSKYSWNIDHILPQDRNVTDDLDNLIISNIQTNYDKANNKRFQVKEIDDIYRICEHENNPELYDDPKIVIIY